MTSVQIRNKWISFFERKGHIDVSNRSLIPSIDDSSLLFINSGVAAIKDYFCRKAAPPSNRLVSCQKVIRTGDIESIGDSFRHHTYFEMLGNFSLGDYFKKEIIPWAWEFLTKELNLDPDKLYISIYKEDNEALLEWQKLIPKDRIVIGDRDTNFWDMGVGPCGPCSEIYFDKGVKYDNGNSFFENDRYLEIWNIVFSEFFNVDGNIVPADSKNIDTGAGLERLVSIIEGKESNFETSLFTPITAFLSRQFNLKKPKLWAAADYLRTSCFLIREGIRFGNKGREYVLRKLFRKSLVILNNFSLDSSFFKDLVFTISQTLPYYVWNLQEIERELESEYSSFKKSYEISSAFLADLLEKNKEFVPEIEIFKLVTTYGLDHIYIFDFLEKNNRSFSISKFNELMNEHKINSFNKNISAAFSKTHPNLLSLDFECRMNYSELKINSKIEALFDQEFNLVDFADEGYLSLDNTILFPSSAGQDSDIGIISSCKISSSFKTVNGQILHKFSGEKFKVGNVVEVSLDTENRRGLEIHHTLEHLFLELLKREISSEIDRVGGQKHNDSFTLEISVPTFVTKDLFDIQALNTKLNELISKNLDVSFSYISLEEALQRGFSQKFLEVYKASKDRLRVVNIGNYSIELCSGTHLSNTRFIEKAKIIEFKKKQSKVYKFRVVGGRKVFDDLKKSIILPSNSNFFSDTKKEFIEEIISYSCGLLIVNRYMDLKVVSAVFKSLKSRLRDRLVIWYSLEANKSYRFFIAGELVDLSKLSFRFREIGWKCGGTSNLMNGTAYSSDFKKDVINAMIALGLSSVVLESHLEIL